MEIKNIKINGIKNPVGYNFDNIFLSYYIDGIPDGELVLDIYDENEKNVYSRPLDYAENYHTEINFSPEKQTRYNIVISCGKAKGAAYFETGTNFDCDFVTPAEEISHPVVFKEFNCGKIKKARLYITGLGLYEAKLNGQKVGNEFLTPYCNDYRAYLQYQTYDITELLQENNLLEISLGDGWYKGRFGLKHKTDIYGSEYACACKLVIWTEDGIQVIKSDESFKARTSHTVASGIYDGEIIDETLDCSHVCSVKKCATKYNAVPRISLPVVVKHTLKPKLIITPKGEKVLDFGQNFSGFVSFENFLNYGEGIYLRAGEVLKDGCFFRDNLRTAKAEFKYKSDGKKKIVYPKFTFYGFRYMLVECNKEINADAFTGNALYSDLDETCGAVTDNEKMNRLIQNCVWGQRSNFLDVPTDCPQRDERLGWTGDAEVFSATACYQMDCRAFYQKYMRDIGIEQNYLNGSIPSYAPGFGETDVSTSVWADAVTIIPWTVYEFYGDKDILERSFPMMERYVDNLIAEDNRRGGNRLYNYGFHLGDWLSQDGIVSSALKAGTNEYFVASCYYYQSVLITSKTASVLGDKQKTEYYGEIAKQIRNAILREYFTVSGRLAIDTQTAYTLCVMFDIYVDKARLYDSFRKRMLKDCLVIKGGFVGATKLVQALFKSGLDDIAFTILYSEKFPGWLYCVNLGATTNWERWNSLNSDGTMSDPTMNSFNHYSFGAVAEAIYRNISGITPLDVAFKKVVIEPKFNYRLKKFDYKFVSPAGEFSVNYVVRGDGSVKLNISVPFGVDAKLLICGNETSLSVGKNEVEIEKNERLIHPFSVDCTVCEILDDEKSSMVFAKEVPNLYWYFTHNTIGMEGYSLRDIAQLSSFRIPDDKLNELDEKLKAIAA